MTDRGFIPYSSQWIDTADIDAVREVFYSDWITQGPGIGEFESVLASYCGAKYAVSVSSGTAALHIACLAAGIKEGREVITSPVTFVASANCVLYCGARPVFCDVREDTVNIDPEKMEEKITEKTTAVIPVHFAGHPCDMEQIQEKAKRHGLTVIEDAAHALGAEYKGRKTGCCRYSDMAILSFHPVKSITTGEGGAVLTNSKDLYEKLLLYRTHGITKDREKMQAFEGPWYYEMQSLGFNYRITDFQCVLGISQLKKLDKFIEKRRALALAYNDELSGIEAITLPLERKDVKSAWHLYPVRLNPARDAAAKRKALFEYLRANNIGVQVHYIPLYKQPYYQKLGYGEKECPVAEGYYERTISLPLYPRMEDADTRYVVKVLRQGLEEIKEISVMGEASQ